jgi:hypothetical protein
MVAQLRLLKLGSSNMKLDKNTDYHPSTVSLVSQKSKSGSLPTLFYWKGEDITDATRVMHFRMTQRAYEQMLTLIAGSDLRAQPSQKKS